MGKAFVAPLLVAAGFGISVLSVSQQSWWRFWGMFWGSVVSLVVLGFSLWFHGRRRGRGRLGKWFTVAVLLIFSFLVISWNISWGLDLFSLEGMWLWPLGAVPLIAAIIFMSSGTRRKRDIWTDPGLPSGGATSHDAGSGPV